MTRDEGITKFNLEHRDAPLPREAHARVAAIAAWRRVLIKLAIIGRDPLRYGGAGYGNGSARITPYPGERGRRRFVITGSQTGVADERSVAPLCVVEAYDPKRNSLRSFGPIRPSSESLTHGAIYDLDPRIRFVFHGHVPYIWRFAAELSIPCSAPQVGYGTPEMAFEMMRLYRDSTMADSQIVAMLGHEDGVIAFGRNIDDAGAVLVRYLARAFALVNGGVPAAWC